MKSCRTQWVQRSKKGDKRANFRPVSADFKPERADFRPVRADFRSERADFRPLKADFRPLRTDFKHLRTDLRSERADFRSERADFEGRDGRTNKRTNERKSPCVLQDFVPFGAAAQKPTGRPRAICGQRYPLPCFE